MARGHPNHSMIIFKMLQKYYDNGHAAYHMLVERFAGQQNLDTTSLYDQLNNTKLNGNDVQKYESEMITLTVQQDSYSCRASVTRLSEESSFPFWFERAKALESICATCSPI